MMARGGDLPGKNLRDLAPTPTRMVRGPEMWSNFNSHLHRGRQEKRVDGDTDCTPVYLLRELQMLTEF